MAALGVADSYDVWLIQSPDAANLGVSTVGWNLPVSRIAWQRLANNVSQAQVEVEAQKTTGSLPPLAVLPWRHAIVIMRNGYTVWTGPIVSWSRTSSGTLVLGARDGAVALQKQLVGATRNFVDAPVSAAAITVASDAQLGDTDYTAYPFTVGSFYPLGWYGFSEYAETAVATKADANVTRQIDPQNQETVDSVYREWVNQGVLWFTYANDHLYFNEPGVRQGLVKDDDQWPVLHDDNVEEPPTVNADGLDIVGALAFPSTVVNPYFPNNQYVNTSATYTNWAYVDGIRQSDSVVLPDLAALNERAWDRSPALYQTGVYPGTAGLESPSRRYDIEDARAGWATHAAPHFTVERVRLRPGFSHPALLGDLSNLLPGCRFSVGFSDRYPFDVAFAERRVILMPTGVHNHAAPVPTQEPRPPQSDDKSNAYYDAKFWHDWRLASLWANRIDHLRLVQMDVEVSVNDGAITETVDLSLVPTAQVVLDEHAAGEYFFQYSSAAGAQFGYLAWPMPVRPRYVN